MPDIGGHRAKAEVLDALVAEKAAVHKLVEKVNAKFDSEKEVL